MQGQKGYIIHLETANERLPHIISLQEFLPWDLKIFKASDGSLFQTKKYSISQGNMGCTHSHLLILKELSEASLDFITIFEDDCQFNVKSKEAVEAFIKEADNEWDILLLGANEYAHTIPGPSATIKQVKRFWGTHAILVKRRVAKAILATFDEMQKEGNFPPADWLYNEAIKRHNLICYGPSFPNKFCRQALGLVSAITGNVRQPF